MEPDIRVVAIAVAKPAEQDAVEAEIRRCVDRTRREPGCRFYVATREAGRADRFVFVEHWDSRSALDAHMKTPHFLALATLFETALSEPLQITVLETFA